MKKNLIAPFIATICALSITACGNSASTEAPAETEAMTEAETSETSEPDAASEEGMTVNLANPWKECTEADAMEFAPNLFSAPEGSENIVWSMMENPDTESEFSFPLVQMTFDYEGNSFTAREWYGVPEDTDISGMYYEWTATEDVTLANWGGGQMPGTTYRFIGDDKYVDLITWHDLETGALYSLSCEAPNLDGFDIQAVAEAMYDESKQESAKIPDAEDSHVPMDITGCDTFTQIVDKLENGVYPDNEKYTDFFAEFMNAEVIEFNTVSK